MLKNAKNERGLMYTAIRLTETERRALVRSAAEAGMSIVGWLSRLVWDKLKTRG